MTTDLAPEIRQLLLASAEGRQHVAFFAAIPDQLIPFMAGFWWDQDRLFALDLPTEMMAMNDLLPFLDAPYWRPGRNAGLFQLTARDVQTDPVTHADHWERTLAADLAYPLMLFRGDERVVLMDGYHRLLKAEVQQVTSLPVRIVTATHLPAILLRDGFLGELNRLTSPALIPTLREIARDLIATHPAGTFPAWS